MYLGSSNTNGSCALLFTQASVAPKPLNPHWTRNKSAVQSMAVLFTYLESTMQPFAINRLARFSLEVKGEAAAKRLRIDRNDQNFAILEKARIYARTKSEHKDRMLRRIDEMEAYLQRDYYSKEAYQEKRVKIITEEILSKKVIDEFEWVTIFEDSNPKEKPTQHGVVTLYSALAYLLENYHPKFERGFFVEALATAKKTYVKDADTLARIEQNLKFLEAWLNSSQKFIDRVATSRNLRAGFFLNFLLHTLRDEQSVNLTNFKPGEDRIENINTGETTGPSMAKYIHTITREKNIGTLEAFTASVSELNNRAFGQDAQTREALQNLIDIFKERILADIDT